VDLIQAERVQRAFLEKVPPSEGYGFSAGNAGLPVEMIRCKRLLAAAQLARRAELHSPFRRAYPVGMPAKFNRVWTREEVLALPEDGNRYELVDGELLVSPSPRWLHQRAVGVLYKALDGYLTAHRFATAMMSPADLDLRAGQVVQPDVFVAAGIGDREWTEVGIPLLVAEVLSPSRESIDRDENVKRKRYQRSGVPTYWIVDVDEERVEVWTPDAVVPRIERRRLTWAPQVGIPRFEIDLPTFFRDVRQTG
jgi:Uma2 family endonuclease